MTLPAWPCGARGGRGGGDEIIGDGTQHQEGHPASMIPETRRALVAAAILGAIGAALLAWSWLIDAPIYPRTGN
jgi:hypothetical protein